MLSIDAEAIEEASHVFCMPIAMLINFSLFQYLIGFYWKRRHEWRVKCLFLFALGGVAGLVPFDYPVDHIVNHLNDVSETCSTLTFLSQITIQGWDLEKKTRIKSLRLLLYIAEALSFVGILVILLNTLEVSVTAWTWTESFSSMDSMIENGALVYILFYRLYFSIMAFGFQKMVRTRKLELTCYLLFATHEYPFMILTEYSPPDVSWDDVQALWNRLTIMMCILVSIRDRIRSSSGSRKTKFGKSQVDQGKLSVGSPSTADAVSPFEMKKEALSKAPGTTPSTGSLSAAFRAVRSFRSRSRVLIAPSSYNQSIRVTPIIPSKK